MTPPVVALRSPRAEKLLTEQTILQQQKIDQLENLLSKQAKELKATSASHATQGGTISDHWDLAIGHAQMAIGGMCACLRRSLIPISTTSRASVKPDPTVQQGGSLHGRKNILPSWAAKTETNLNASFSKARESASTLNSSNRLEEHEYVLEDEWGFAKTNGVINPKSRWKESWDICILVLIIYSAIVVPFRICFSAEAVGTMWTFEVVASVLFIIDVCFNLNTAYPVEDKWVINRQRITARYLSGEALDDSQIPGEIPLPPRTAVQTY